MRGRIKINAEERRSLNSDNRIEIYLLGTSLKRNEELKGRLGGAREQEREDCAAGGSQDKGADWGKVAALGCFFVCKGRTHYFRKNLNSIQTLQSAF